MAKIHKRGYYGEEVFGAMCCDSALWTLHGNKPPAKIQAGWKNVTCKRCLARRPHPRRK